MEQLAYAIRVEKGEEEDFTVYPNPDIKILEKLKQNKKRTQLWSNLPTELGYKKIKERGKENEQDKVNSTYN